MKIGDKIKRLRLKNGLTQEELANRCELTKGFISQVERDLTSPSIATLIDILDCLGTNLKDFFSEGVDEKIVFRKEDIFEMQNNELNHLIKWLVPNAQKILWNRYYYIWSPMAIQRNTILMMGKNLVLFCPEVLIFIWVDANIRLRREKVFTSSHHQSIA